MYTLIQIELFIANFQGIVFPSLLIDISQERSGVCQRYFPLAYFAKRDADHIAKRIVIHQSPSQLHLSLVADYPKQYRPRGKM